ASLFLIAGAVERRTTTGEFRLLGGMARGRPALATLLMTVGVISLAVPGSASFAGEFLILAGVFQRAWWWAAIGAGAIVLAAMYMLRLISAVLHEARGFVRDVGRRLHGRARPLGLALRRQRRRAHDRLRRLLPRPLDRVGADHPLRYRPGHDARRRRARARLGTHRGPRPPRRPHRGVLRAAPRLGRRNDVFRRRGKSHDALPLARVVLDRALRHVRDRL